MSAHTHVDCHWTKSKVPLAKTKEIANLSTSIEREKREGGISSKDMTLRVVDS